MLISKNGKKLMAFVMSLAMLLTGLLYVPKPAEAAENDNVEVLGATLRFSDADVDNNGRQSMRLGIAVPNASKTKSCQIKVTVNGVSKVISTEPAETEGVDLQHNKILSYDEGTDTAIYAIVIKGISKDNFYTNIEMTGQSTDLEGETTHTSKKKSRNVMGVVNALKEKYPDLKIDIDENGNLYTNGDKSDKLVLGDLKDYDDTKPGIYEKEELDLSSAIEDGKIEKAPDGKGIYIKDLGTGYKSIKLGHKVNEGRVIGVKIEGNIGENSDGLRCYPSTINDSNSADANLLRIEEKGDFSEDAEFTIGEGDKNYAEYLCIKGKQYGAQLKDVTIRSITVTYINSDPAPTATPEIKYGWNEDQTEYNLKPDKESVKCEVGEFDSEGFKITDTKDEHEIGIVLPEDIYKANKFEKAIITYSDKVDDTGQNKTANYVVKYDTSSYSWSLGEENGHNGIFTEFSGESVLTPRDKDKHMSAIRIYDRCGSITIRSIVFVKAQEVEATPTPTPQYELAESLKNIDFGTANYVVNEDGSVTITGEGKGADIVVPVPETPFTKVTVQYSDYRKDGMGYGLKFVKKSDGGDIFDYPADVFEEGKTEKTKTISADVYPDVREMRMFDLNSKSVVTIKKIEFYNNDTLVEP